MYSPTPQKRLLPPWFICKPLTQASLSNGFVLGKAQLAPLREHSIPRLELCATVLAVEVAQFALEQLDLKIDNVKFYTDSKVVLGYISNETRRFIVYVGNRVERIRKYSTPKQWNYFPTDCNPADSATRTLQAHEMHSSKWLLGPTRSLYCEK
jgi:ribonuclease HI